MKTGLKTIIAGALLFTLGAFVVPLVFLLPLFLGKSQDLQFKAPGSVEATVKEPGRYYLWNDFRTLYEGKSYDRSEGIPDGMEVKIHDAAGRTLEFFSDTSIYVSSGSSSKRSIGFVEVESPGKVQIQVAGGNDERIFSFSQSRLLKIFGLLVGGIGLSAIIGVTGFGLIIWGIVKLVRRNRRSENP